MFSQNYSCTFSKSNRQGLYNIRYRQYKPSQLQQIDDFIGERLEKENVVPSNIVLQFINLAKKQFDLNIIVIAMKYVDDLKNLLNKETGEPLFNNADELIITSFIITDFFVTDKPYMQGFIKQNGINFQTIDEKLKYLMQHYPEVLFCTNKQCIQQNEEFRLFEE